MYNLSLGLCACACACMLYWGYAGSSTRLVRQRRIGAVTRARADDFVAFGCDLVSFHERCSASRVSVYIKRVHHCTQQQSIVLIIHALQRAYTRRASTCWWMIRRSTPLPLVRRETDTGESLAWHALST